MLHVPALGSTPSSQADKKIALAALEFARERLSKTEPLASALDGAAYPAEDASSQDLEAVVAGVISGHAIGTCSMLPRDKRGVVDDDLKVLPLCRSTGRVLHILTPFAGLGDESVESCGRERLSAGALVRALRMFTIAETSDQHTSNHPQATVYATAHKAAAAIQRRRRDMRK